MPFGKTYAEIKELILDTALQTSMCRDIVRRGGLLGGSGVSNLGIPVNVLTQSWIVEPWGDVYPTRHENDRYGISWDPAHFDNIPGESWPTSEHDPFAEGGDFTTDGYYHTIVDLTGYVNMRNVIYVSPNTPQPPCNVRVEASLDGETWDLATDHDAEDWLYAGCNVNCGAWPATAEEARGGMIASEWQSIANEFRLDGVKLRWTFFVSPVDDSSIYAYLNGTQWGTQWLFGYSTVQVS